MRAFMVMIWGGVLTVYPCPVECLHDRYQNHIELLQARSTAHPADPELGITARGGSQPDIRAGLGTCCASRPVALSQLHRLGGKRWLRAEWKQSEHAGTKVTR